MNKQNKISLILGVLVLTVLIVTSSFAYFQITNTDSSTDTNFTGELEDIEDYGKSVLTGGIEGYHINILASDMAPSKIGTHYYGTIDTDSNYSLERKNYEISNASIVDGKNNENVAYTCTSELTITLKGSLTGTKEDGTYYIQEGDGTLYLSGSNLKIDKRQIDLKEIIENATQNEEGIKEYKKTLTYNISKGNNGTLNVDFDIINRDVVQNDIAGKNITITLRNSNLQCEVSGRKVYMNSLVVAKTDYDIENPESYKLGMDKQTAIEKIEFVKRTPSEEEINGMISEGLAFDLTDTSMSPEKSVIGWLEPSGNRGQVFTETFEQQEGDLYNLYIGSKDSIYAKDLSGMFTLAMNLKDIKFDNLNTSETTDMVFMFALDGNLTTLDLSDFDTSFVNNMSYMFYNYNGTTLDLSTFDTSKVTDMSSMFNYANIGNIMFPQGFGSATTNMSNMFSSYKGTSLDLSVFDTSSVTDMSYMFYNISADITFPEGFGSAATDMSYMFSNTSVELKLSNFDTSQVTDMSYMFYNTSVELPFKEWPNFVTSSVNNMSYMFYNYNGTTLDLSSFDTSSVTDMNAMFYDDGKLTTLDLSSFTFDNVTTEGGRNAGNYHTFYGVPSSCEVKINPSQLETFKDKFPLGTGTYDRKFRVPGEE